MEYVPAVQFSQVLTEEFTASENVPAPQSVHASDPACVLYLPVIQPTHGLLGPDQPALQTQSVMESLAGGASEFRHGSQCVLLSVEYVPAVQFSQVLTEEFTASKNVPAPQSVHA